MTTTTFIKLMRDDAVLPTKAYSSDAGFDVTIIGRKDNNDNNPRDSVLTPILFHTGLKLQPPEGYYFELVARSSLQKRGYMLGNSIGIIDNSYRGELLVSLVKFDQYASDLELPCRVAQLIPRKMVDMNLESVDDLNDTQRQEGGFGSTN